MVIGTMSESSLYPPHAPEIGPAEAHRQPRSNAPQRQGVITGAQGGHSTGAEPRLVPKLQFGPSEDTRLFFDAQHSNSNCGCLDINVYRDCLVYT